MGKSKKKFPCGPCIGHSQKCGKQLSHRRFRRREHILIQNGKYDNMPFRQYEITNKWNLGGDGKCFWGFARQEEWYIKAIALGGEKPIYTNIDVTVFDMNGISESRGKNAELIKKERRAYLESIVPASVLRDYDAFAFPIEQYQRLCKYHLWGLVYFLERVLFKLEKWGLLK